ncbi:Nucleolar complex protein 3-like protein [Thalictrum thalictroides]|uniref:Nucleolar complex protein 3-like protein n=1 Tax=Thalictrum thalictroides TaxID=46969 RepID=A0A7J6VXS1_THATH|nr:Nucleolar complex protein 3-like protein [Thalictrum thalictroides]
MVKKRKVVLPPELPPDVGEDEVEVSDEDLQFLTENQDYAGLLRNLDTKSITKHVKRIANQKEDAIEALYEKRSKRKSLDKDSTKDELEVDPVDVLPVKTLDGKIYYKTAPKKNEKSGIGLKNVEGATEDKDKDDDGIHESVVKLTKAEKRAKMKKSRKEAKKQAKEPVKTEDAQENLQAEVLAEVKEELSAEGIYARKKSKLAELGMALLADPESNIKFLKEMLQICKDEDESIVKLGLQSMLVVFKDIIPGYRIRLPTEKELEMNVSKAVKKMRFYETTLLSSYKVYLQKLVALEKKSSFQDVIVRCMCDLLEAVPHFNFRGNLLAAVVNNISSTNDVIRKHCRSAIKSLFTDEGKHGGEATVEAVHLIADHVKIHDCQLPPDSIEVFLSLSFDDDLGKPQAPEIEETVKNKGKKAKKEERKKEKASNKKRSRKDLLESSREEVDDDLKATSFAPNALERRRMQSETLYAVFQTYFRVLKHSMRPTTDRSTMHNSYIHGRFGTHPLLAPCLNGLGKFSHLIDLDYMGDLMNCLKMLASGGGDSDSSPGSILTVSERLRCCIVAFKVMRTNLDALNVDLQEFFVQLYNLILEYRPDRDQGGVLAEALKIMLCEGRQHDMQRAAAFIKRLATSSLFFGSAEAMAALVTLREILQKNAKCRNLLENDAGGGSVSGSLAKYQPCVADPNQSGALASVLWELSLLSKHYHPAISTAASSILSINTANQVYLATTSPEQAFADLSIEQESFDPKQNSGKQNRKRKHTIRSSILNDNEATQYSGDEEDLQKRFSDHFTVLRDIAENERLRRELKHTVSSIKSNEDYKKQKMKKQGALKKRGAKQ